jgi:hypothetical protein
MVFVYTISGRCSAPAHNLVRQKHHWSNNGSPDPGRQCSCEEVHCHRLGKSRGMRSSCQELTGWTSCKPWHNALCTVASISCSPRTGRRWINSHSLHIKAVLHHLEGQGTTLPMQRSVRVAQKIAHHIWLQPCIPPLHPDTPQKQGVRAYTDQVLSTHQFTRLPVRSTASAAPTDRLNGMFEMHGLIHVRRPAFKCCTEFKCWMPGRPKTGQH